MHNLQLTVPTHYNIIGVVMYRETHHHTDEGGGGGGDHESYGQNSVADFDERHPNERRATPEKRTPMDRRLVVSDNGELDLLASQSVILVGARRPSLRQGSIDTMGETMGTAGHRREEAGGEAAKT